MNENDRKISTFLPFNVITLHVVTLERSFPIHCAKLFNSNATKENNFAKLRDINSHEIKILMKFVIAGRGLTVPWFSPRPNNAQAVTARHWHTRCCDEVFCFWWCNEPKMTEMLSCRNEIHNRHDFVECWKIFFWASLRYFRLHLVRRRLTYKGFAENVVGLMSYLTLLMTCCSQLSKVVKY